MKCLQEQDIKSMYTQQDLIVLSSEQKAHTKTFKKWYQILNIKSYTKHDFDAQWYLTQDEMFKHTFLVVKCQVFEV
jgi:hypothetical protein